MMNVVWIILLGFCVQGLLADVDWASSRSFAPITRVKELRQKVFILTLPRSGSTFISEIFRQNPEYVYLFETTRGFSEPFETDGCQARPADGKVEGIMRDLYDCDFRPLQELMDTLYWKGHLYSWDRVADLSGINRDETMCFLKGNEADTQQNKVKRGDTSVVIKEITMWAPKLNWLHETLGSELRVLWLIRDVRGWVSSWLVPAEGMDKSNTFYHDWGYDQVNLWERYAQCDVAILQKLLGEKLFLKIQGILTNSSSEPHLKMAAWWSLDTALTFHNFASFSGKFLLVQYEHLSLFPLDVTQQIYSFLGRNITNEGVLRWLIDATKGGDANDRYHTNRDSSMMTKIWLERLTMQQIRQIEEIAGVWFPFFGYQKAEFGDK